MTTPDTTDASRPPARTASPGDAVRAATAGSALVRATRQQPVPHTPVWFMRQAGRSLPEYRKVREGVAMLESCRRPDLVAEITLQPVRRHGVDAAIFFSDIVVPAGGDRRRPRHRARGRARSSPRRIRTRADLDQLRDLTPDDVTDITEAVRAAHRRARRHPADRLRGRPVHPRVVPRRGRPVAEPRAHQGAHVRRPASCGTTCCARLAQISGAFLRVQVEAGASVGAALRLLGRRAVPRRLPAVRAAALGHRARGGRRPRRARASTSASAPVSCSR